MGEIVTQILLSILAILLPPIAAFIKVYIYFKLNSYIKNIYLGWMYNTFLD